MQIEYRRLVRGDESEYRRIRLECLRRFPDNFGSRYEEEAAVPVLPFESYIREESPDHFIFGAYPNGKLVGIAGFSRRDRKKTRHRGEIVHMYVDPDHRGQRIGESLLREVIEAAFALDGIESLELSAVASNTSAQKLYEKIGFETFGIQKNYFKDGDRYWDQRFMQMPKNQYKRVNQADIDAAK